MVPSPLKTYMWYGNDALVSVAGECPEKAVPGNAATRGPLSGRIAAVVATAHVTLAHETVAAVATLSARRY
jgi:hypothetical protein